MWVANIDFSSAFIPLRLDGHGANTTAFAVIVDDRRDTPGRNR
jgi:hypothetical protein